METATMKATLTIPEPCHEDWGRMDAAGTGRLCHSCQHTVMDLSRHSDAQLLALLRADAMPKCARFSRGQLDRVIALEGTSGPRLLPAAMLGSALAMQAPELAAQQQQPVIVETPVVEMELGEVEVILHRTRGLVEPDPAPAICPPPTPVEEIPELFDPEAVGNTCTAITGRVLDEAGEAVPFANIFAPELKLGTVSAMDGTFRLVVPDSLGVSEIALSISFPGYTVRRFTGISLPVAKRPPLEPGVWDDAALTVRILTDSPADLHGLSVELNDGSGALKPDARGFVGFAHPGAGGGRHAVLVRDGTAVLHRVLVPQEALPGCVLVDLRTAAAQGAEDAQASPCGVDLGEVVLRPSEVHIMGELVTYAFPHKPTVWSRMARPFRMAWWKARTALHR